MTKMSWKNLFKKIFCGCKLKQKSGHRIKSQKWSQIFPFNSLENFVNYDDSMKAYSISYLKKYSSSEEPYNWCVCFF